MVTTIRQRIPSWTALRAIGNSTAAKLSIFMPFIGHLILFNQYVSELFINLSPSFGVGGGISFGWKMYFLYIGLFLMGVASSIYQLRCHQVIKRYSDKEDFVLSVSTTVTRRDIKEFLNAIRLSPEAADYDFNYNLVKQQFDSRAGVPESQQDESLRVDVMKMYYVVLADANALSRGIALTCYAIAFACLAVPSADTFFRVLRLMFKM